MSAAKVKTVKRRQVRSKSDLFRGELVDMPRQSKSVGEDADGETIFECPNCGDRATADECDVCGAEPGCMFCNQCNREFRM